MSFRVRINGVQIEADTVEDVYALFSRFGVLNGPETQPAPTGEVQVNGVDARNPEAFTESVRDVLRRLAEKQRAFVDALAAVPEGQTDAQMRQHCHVNSNIALSGVMSHIAKAAVASNLNPRAVFDKERLLEGGRRVGYRFFLRPRFLAAYQELQGAEAAGRPTARRRR
jgi:hypothetical protein